MGRADGYSVRDNHLISEPTGRERAVVVRVGDGSLHPGWLAEDRSFDLIVDYYGSTPGRWDGTADLVVENHGSKWQGLHRLLTEHPFIADRYRHVWFPDDDIDTDAATIDSVFDLHEELALGLSQPALTADSYFTHLATLAHPGITARLMNFVEVMVPVFSRETLRACFDTFDLSRSGFGLDLVWQTILPGLGLRSAILDAVTVRHTRPVGTGTLYDGMAEQPGDEGIRVARRFGSPSPTRLRVEELVLPDGERLSGIPALRAVTAWFPHPTIQTTPVWDTYRADLLSQLQESADPPVPPPPLALPPRLHAEPTTPSSEPEGPLAVVVAPASGSSVAALWTRAGFATIKVKHPDQVARNAGRILGHRTRILDIRCRDLTTIERAVEVAEALGALALVSVPAEAVRCGHGTDPRITAVYHCCPTCLRTWLNLADRNTVLTTSSDSVRAWFGTHAPGVDLIGPLEEADRRTVAAADRPADVEPMTVAVLFDREDDLGPVTDAVAHQRGLLSPCDLVAVPRGDADAWTALASAPGPDRVLILDVQDRPDPWMVAAHRQAVKSADDPAGAEQRGEVVVSRGHAGFGDGLGIVEAVVADCAPLLAPADRCSVARDDLPLVAPLLRDPRSSAHTPIGWLVRHRPAQRLAPPTHSGRPFRSLASVRRGTMLDVFATGAPVDGAPAQLTYWSHTHRAQELVLHRFVAITDRQAQRLAPAEATRGLRTLDLLRSLITEDLLGHEAAATAAISAVQDAAAAGRSWTIAVESDDHRLAALYATIETLVGEGRLRSDSVRVDVSDDTPATLRLGADLCLARDDRPWSPGLPVPLIDALDLPTWLTALYQAEGSRPPADPTDPLE